MIAATDHVNEYIVPGAKWEEAASPRKEPGLIAQHDSVVWRLGILGFNYTEVITKIYGSKSCCNAVAYILILVNDQNKSYHESS